MPSLAQVRAANAAYKPAYVPVALFVGGTSGVGQACAKAFACVTNGNAHIIVCGRNRAAGEATIASFPKPPASSSAWKHEFVECDVSLMKNVHRTTTELLERLEKLNFLSVSPGIVTMSGRTETEEGLDKKMALHYYARWKFIHDLMPLLRKAKEKGEDASVMTILGAGRGGPIDLNDLGVKKNYTLGNAAKTTNTYNDLMLEAFHEQNPDIGFTHQHPGAVNTNILKHSDIPGKSIMQYALYPLAAALTRSPEEAGHYLLYGLLQGAQKGGVYRRDPHGVDIGKDKYFGSEEAVKKVWEHTVEATKVE
ncbi:NAD P-binding protein [Gloeophyllum trabeum ATCC 11539]|uniref:NAD P-binding protein n=1 Tax=Gloeophyllum trabeum (strain ATCC 11539 / FP-39264 / Madison 617) TaxID=670483 RepID=S7RGP2_GLOTA|nr:NAD P-binding protein [Gloeophyllum trabeum ATCC 11539]EPQ51734.1 NAD P-binding protein [Gloeophyllum trabeum ATCC 11539]